jgi:hypothetical protein
MERPATLECGVRNEGGASRVDSTHTVNGGTESNPL